MTSTEQTRDGSDRKDSLPLSDSERRDVRDELESILASPSFRGSKRCSKLLRYVVEHALIDSAEPLKELTLGFEVFGRPPRYNTDVDSTVRTAANDVRKRLAQYYVGSGVSSKVRIDLPCGSYMPQFQWIPDIPQTPPALTAAPRRRFPGVRAIIPAGLALLLITVATWVWLRPNSDVIDDFWGPVWGQDDSVLVVVRTRGWETSDSTPPASNNMAAPSANVPAPTLVEETQDESVSLSDAVSLSRLSGLLQSHGKRWHVKRPEHTTFTDLKTSPAVLIGNPRNLWTRRLSDQMRFSARRDFTTNISWIQDRTDPTRRDWKVNLAAPYDQVYGLVSRVLDSTTGRMIVAVEGVTKYGTQAASQFVTDPIYLQAAFSRLSNGRDAKNIQIVITAKLIDGVPGPPQTLAVHAW